MKYKNTKNQLLFSTIKIICLVNICSYNFAVDYC